jgi:hypothetical protein
MTTYTKDDYTVSGTFSGDYDSSSFKTAIMNSAITRTIIDTGILGDSVQLIFDGVDVLSVSDTNILDILSTSSNPAPLIYSSVTQVMIKENEINSEDFEIIGKFLYPGSNSASLIGKILVTGYCRNINESFIIIVLNKENGDEMAGQIFNNETEAVLDLGTIFNIPTTKSRIEILAQVSNKRSQRAYIENISVFYL